MQMQKQTNKPISYILMGIIICKEINCDSNNIKGQDRCIGLECLYTTETKLVLFKLDYYRLKVLKK